MPVLLTPLLSLALLGSPGADTPASASSEPPTPAAPSTAAEASTSVEPSEPAVADASPRAAFQRQAWKIVVDEPSLLPTMPRHLRYTVSVVDGAGAEVPADELVAAAPGKHAAALNTFHDKAWLRPATLGVSIALAFVPPVLGVLGMVAGGLAGGVVGYVSRTQSSGGKDPLAEWIPAVLVASAGAALGLGFGAIAWVPVAFLVGQGVSGLVEPPDGRAAFAAAVREHNTRLARDLDIDPATLDPAHFPTAG